MTVLNQKVVEVLSSLDYDALVEFQRALLSGGSSIRQVVSRRLREIAASESRTCATCGCAVNLRTASEFTLIFGPPELKKKLSFCALDCMDYFSNNLKHMAAKKIQT